MGTVDDYLSGLDVEDRAAVERVYAIAREVVPDAEQGMGYGMPALTYRGKSLISVMRAKTHIGVYPFSGSAVTAAGDLLAGYDVSKGAVRFQPEHPLSDAAIRALVQSRLAEIESH